MRNVLWVLLLVCGFLLPYQSASAQELTLQQRILMPGPLTEDHADLETNCENCHSPFEQEEMSTLCLDCHEEITEDRTTNDGFHGKSSLAVNSSCESCHTDHEGRDTNITGLLPDSFDHDNSRFPLLGAHRVLSCNGCHEESDRFRDLSASCVDCHQDQDIHNNALEDSCDTCHESESWQQRLPFDHSVTDFELEGGHVELNCNNCHLGQVYEFADTSCASCHSSTEVHDGAFGNKCETCHIVDNWEEVGFNHEETEFPLNGAHVNMSCATCHNNDQSGALTAVDRVLPIQALGSSAIATISNSLESSVSELVRGCSDCHKSDDVHLGRNGNTCKTCHDTDTWQEFTFDHSADTDYDLTGKHAEVSCTQCHSGSLEAELGTDCLSCHVGDNLHDDPQMEQCESCHTSTEWASTQLFDHDFSVFPLLGMHEITPCESCHIDSQLTATDTKCISCHEQDDVHEDSLGDSCNQCHTPNSWDIWRFDHSTQTEYVLEGQHESLSCASCHLPATEPAEISNECSDCHIDQDIHRGNFGIQCEQCHVTNDFSEIYVSGRGLRWED